MRRLIWITLGAAVVAGSSAVALAQQQFVFFASIADSTGAPVASLAADDLKIVENGAEGKVVKIEPIDWPIRLQIMLNTGSRSESSFTGANQTNVGIAVAKDTGGRYEAIAASTRIATLLPEIGEQVAKSHVRQSHQFRITFQRPGGASGAVGEIAMASRPGTTPTLTINGRMP